MCWIFAYKGQKNPVPLLLHGLEKLEYRGYDSAGLFALDPKSWNQLYARAVGKVSQLVGKLNWNHGDIKQWIGLAHSRWATHGGVTEMNAHPHHDSSWRYYLAHNGIIENYHKLKLQLENEWYEFYSETDTEIIAALMHKYASDDFLASVEKVIGMLTGAFGLIIIDTKFPDKLIGFRRWSPLIFAKHKCTDWTLEFYFASDTQSLSGMAQEYIYLEDGELVYIDAENYIVKSQQQVLDKPFEILHLSEQDTEKGWYEHFMLKEIHEQPAVIRRILKGRVNAETWVLDADALDYLETLDIKKIIIIWCGTSYHAWLLGASWINQRSWIDVSVKIASEYLYEHITINDQTLFIFVSQSGETADSMEVLKYLKSQWAKTLGIVNVVWSSISRLTDAGMFTRCGYEIGVASTKAFMGQVICFLIISLYLGKKHGMNYMLFKDILKNLQLLPTLLESILADVSDIENIAELVAGFENIFFLGRANHVAIAMEWSLKMKEITYIHSEAYAAWELKHGSLALISPAFLSIVLCPQDNFLEQNMNTIHEIKARNGVVYAISTQVQEKADKTLLMPQIHEVFYPLLETLILQLLSYYTAKNSAGK